MISALCLLIVVVTYWKKNNSVMNINKGLITVNCENPYTNHLNKMAISPVMVKSSNVSENFEKNHHQDNGPNKVNLNKNQDRNLVAGPGTMSYNEEK